MRGQTDASQTDRRIDCLIESRVPTDGATERLSQSWVQTDIPTEDSHRDAGTDGYVTDGLTARLSHRESGTWI